MNWHGLVTRDFPHAIPVSELRSQIRQWLRHGLKTPRHATLLATSLCADDIIASKDLGQDAWGPFSAGGLAGLPFGGLTAFSAWAHHVPEHGTALVVYGPHIGITRDGALGKMLRPGQSSLTGACGSLMAALDRLRRGEPALSSLDGATDDLQQERLLQLLMPLRTRILQSPHAEKEITDVAYELSHSTVQRLIERVRGQFSGAHVAFVGGVVINTDPEVEDWFEIRAQGNFETHHTHTIAANRA